MIRQRRATGDNKNITENAPGLGGTNVRYPSKYEMHKKKFSPGFFDCRYFRCGMAAKLALLNGFKMQSMAVMIFMKIKMYKNDLNENF